MEQGRSIRVIAVLEEVARAEVPLTANEIADRTDLPKATVYRLCDQLLENGLLRRQISGRGFTCGPALIGLSTSVHANQLQYGARRAVLDRIARAIGETCNLAVPERSGMIYWDRVETEWPLRLQLPVGTTVPFHATASGKLYLATMPPARRSHFLDELVLTPATKNTLTDRRALEARLDEIASNGYSEDNEEFIDDMVAIAVPVFDTAGRFVAALATHGPSVRLTPEIARSYLPQLRDGALRLAGSLGVSAGDLGLEDRTNDQVRSTVTVE